MAVALRRESILIHILISSGAALPPVDTLSFCGTALVSHHTSLFTLCSLTLPLPDHEEVT